MALGLALALVAASCGDNADSTSTPSTDDGTTDALGSTAPPADGDDPASPGTEATGDTDTTTASLPEGDGEDGGGGEDGDESSTTSEAEATTPPAEAWDQVALSLQPVAAFSQPMALTYRPGSPDLWVAERVGRVRRVERRVDQAAGTEQLIQSSAVVLDLSDQVGTGGEGGLLGIAFSPDGSSLFVHYTDAGINNVIAEYAMDGVTADRSSERVVLRIEQPFSNHNGGDIRFGPDGLLYLSVGDGGSADDPLGHGQNRATLLGTLLRIDPRGSDAGGYSVPGDNPFVGQAGDAPEIWSWGLRNPWRFSFDAATGDLWIGDVGQGRFEEINFVAGGGAGRGANFGWNLTEGFESFAGAAPADHVPPVFVYGHEQGRCSVTGGFVYRGSLTPDLNGIYIFGDYCTGEVFGLDRSGGSVEVAPLQLDRGLARVVSFGEGPDGEVYVLEDDGRVTRIQRRDLALETTVSAS